MSDRDYEQAAAPIILKSDNPREKLKEITDKLEQGIKELFESDRYKSYLKTLSKFHNYSFNNCLLIAMQKPDATHVAGFASWRDNFKRNVMKGEKGIRILAPSPYKAKKEQDRIDPKSGRTVVGADGKAIKDMVEVTMPAFKVATVFDVSQTDGEPLPEIGVDELSGSVDKYSDFLDALKKSSPVPIEFEDITSGAKGYYDQTERRIAICAGMSELQTLKTAIHELAHARLHHIDKNAPKDTSRPDADTREVEAESVAYVVCQHYGLDTSDYSFGYIAEWSGAKELDTLKSSLDTIRREADAIISEADTHLAIVEQTRDVKQRLADRKLEKRPASERMNPLKTAEMSTEQNLNMIDGVLNNSPTVAELEAKAKSGQPISLSDLAGALKAEHQGEHSGKSADRKPSIREQLRKIKEQLARDKTAPQKEAKPHSRSLGD